MGFCRVFFEIKNKRFSNFNFSKRRFYYGTAEDKMIGWHHQLNEHESEQTPGHGE